MLVLGSFLLVEQKGVLGLDVSDLVIQSKKIVLQVLQLEQLFLEGTNHGVLVGRLRLLQVRSVSGVSIHYRSLMMIALENNNKTISKIHNLKPSRQLN